MAPWTLEMVTRARAGAEAANSIELGRLLDVLGVETAKVWVAARQDRLPTLGPGQESREFVPAWERDKPPERQKIHTETGEFILLSSRFFEYAYPSGVDSAVVVISACSSGERNDLLDAVRGENTAVIGWRKPMSLRAAAAAGTLIAETLVEVDEKLEAESGYSVGQALETIRKRLDELARDPPDFRMCADPTDARVTIEFGSGNPKLTISGPGSFPGPVAIGLDLQKAGTGGADGFCTGLGSEYPPVPHVTITSISTEYVTGSVTGQVHRCDPGHKPAERATIQIDFVASVCEGGVPGRRC